MPKVIDSFSGKYRFLSNFYDSPVVMGGREYRTVEHAFQAAKTRRRSMRRRIAAASKPADAKRLGRSVKLRDDWDEYRLVIMEKLLRRKFSDPTLRQMLVGTGQARLVEGNTWHDTFWGVCDGMGKNHLGKLLMNIREEVNG